MCCLHDDPWPRASDREKEDFPSTAADNTPLFLPLSSPHAEATPGQETCMWGGAGEVTPPVHFRNFFVWFRPYLIFNQNQNARRARERHFCVAPSNHWPLHTVGSCRWRWWRRELVRDLREGELCSVARSSHPYLSTHHSKVASLRSKTAPNCTGVCGQKKSKAKSLGSQRHTRIPTVPTTPRVGQAWCAVTIVA
jgi:hypothetical protein